MGIEGGDGKGFLLEINQGKDWWEERGGGSIMSGGEVFLALLGALICMKEKGNLASPL